MMRRNLTWCLGLWAAGLAGCGQVAPAPPSTLAEYERVQRTNPQAYSQYVILQYNLQRVMDDDLQPAERANSLQVATALGGEDPAVRAQLARVLTDPKTPAEVHQGILAFLLKKDYPDMAGYVVQAMPNLTRFNSLHESVLEWLTRHPTPSVLSEVVKLWEDEPTAAGPNEVRYRQIVERITGKPWDQALLEGLNAPGYSSPGSAVGVLARRLQAPVLRQRLLGVAAKTEDLSALQAWLTRFDYLPGGEDEYASALQIWRAHADMLDDAARLAGVWRDEYGYRFNIRDFHLISRLARDPLRTAQKRSQLIAEIGQALSGRVHLHYKPATGPASDDRFWLKVESLSMADLWNVYLLSELLSRPRTQMAMRIMALGDRADTSGAWGGLVFYKAGQAEATKYPAESRGAPDDLSYVPMIHPAGASKDADFATDQRDCLCRFVCHFEKANNGARAGPTAQELRDAQSGNYYGVVFTSLDADNFAAHYFTPQGAVISLGVYPLRK